ncbi:hypothetical protein [Variovorax atrisoli]|uniref:hypothetical protein n=1 Tax=Variovorax atrisoli TaxID=3394203 RepID=UPI0040401895
MTESLPGEAPVYLEAAASGEFIELHEHDNRLRVRAGAIGRPCLVLHAGFESPDKAHAHRQRLLDAWRARGFVECPPLAQVLEGSVAEELHCDGRVPHPLLAPFFQIDGADELQGQPRRLALFRDGLRWHGDFDLERIAELGLYAGVIVAGDVDVDGVFSQLTHTYPRHVLVGGDVRAASFGHGDSHMRVLGDVRVRNIVYGEYNDGSLRIDGAVHGRAFISADHAMHAKAGCHAPVCDWNSGQNWSDCLHPGLFEADDPQEAETGAMISPDAIRTFMREGRDPFRDGTQPAMDESPRATAEPSPLPPPSSSFAERLRECVEAGDTEAITQLIETWPQRDEEWQQALTGRLFAPSTTPQQRARLKAVQSPASSTRALP